MTVDALLEQLAELVAEKVAARLNGNGSGPSESDRWLTVSEAAALLGVTPRWVYRRTRELPFIRRPSPGVVRCDEAALRKYMAANRRG
jgi:excisionase family DNA binding protein